MNESKLTAIQLVAEGAKTLEEIAEICGCTVRTITNWKQDLLFQAEVSKYLAQVKEELFKTGIAVRANRIARLNKRWNQIDKLINARSTDRSMINVAGGDTGLLCHTQKSLGSGDLATVVDEYKADVGLIKEERELAKQAAQELGQWSESIEVTTLVNHITVDL